MRLGLVLMATMMGMAVGALVSMQAAEVARPYWLSSRAETEIDPTLATVAVEWLLDLLAVLAFFIPARRLVALGTRAGWSGLNVAIALLVLLPLAGLAALRRASRGLPGLCDWFQRSSIVPGKFGSQVVIHLERSVIGLQVLRRPGGLALVAGYSLLTALLTGVSAWLALMAFGLPVPVPRRIRHAGVDHSRWHEPHRGRDRGLSCRVSAGIGVDVARTVAPVLGLHAVLYIPPAAFGVLCLFRARTVHERTPA